MLDLVLRTCIPVVCCSTHIERERDVSQVTPPSSYYYYYYYYYHEFLLPHVCTYFKDVLEDVNLVIDLGSPPLLPGILLEAFLFDICTTSLT